MVTSQGLIYSILYIKLIQKKIYRVGFWPLLKHIIELYIDGMAGGQSNCEKPLTKNYNMKQDDDKEGKDWEDDIGAWCVRHWGVVGR